MMVIGLSIATFLFVGLALVWWSVLSELSKEA